ncbi:MAG: SOS response-associated peptidase [Chloroflexota bacterium]
MCGRFTLTDPAAIEERFGFLDWHDKRVEPRFNIAPGQDILILAVDRGASLNAMFARWGFAPAWTANTEAALKRPPPINARAENLASSALFRDALAHGRCLIPADGFYEWQARPGLTAKQPLRLRLRDRGLFAFAGLWVAGPTGEPTAAIVTCGPNTLVEPIHTRMPVILRREDEALWLNAACTDSALLQQVLCPYPADAMEAYAVAPLVNAADREGPSLIAEHVADAPAQLSLFGAFGTM